MDQIKAVFSEDLKEAVEQTYDIYLLPPGEDPESCQSYLRMRNREGKYNLMFEVHPTNLSPYIICFKILINMWKKLCGYCRYQTKGRSTVALTLAVRQEAGANSFS